MSLRVFLFGMDAKSVPMCCRVSLEKTTIAELIEMRAKFLDVRKTLPNLAYFDTSNFDAEYFESESFTAVNERLTVEEREAFYDKPWVELPPERDVAIFRDIKVARTTNDYAHLDERGIFWSCQEKYSEERWETEMVPWTEFGVKPERDRAALALAIVEQLAHDFATGEDVNGGDLVDWLGRHLGEAGFLDEVQSDASDEATLHAASVVLGAVAEQANVVGDKLEKLASTFRGDSLCVPPTMLHALRVLADKLESNGQFGDDAKILRAIANRVERYEP